MLFLLYFLVATVGASAKETSEEAQSTFRVLQWLIVISWSVYPVAWLVGTEGLNLVGLYGETLLFMILDVLAKVGFGFILLRSRAVIGEGDAPTPSAEAEAAD
jgi:bacteriorhodopsin